MSTLYLVKQGTMLRKDHGRFVVEGSRLAADGKLDGKPDGKQSRSEEAVLEIPIQEVGRILVLGRVQISTSAIEVCLEQQIPVIFMSQTGDYKGHLWSSEFCDLPTEAAQFGRRHDPKFQLEVARQIVWGKGMNSKLTLQRFNYRRKADGVRAILQRIDQLLNTIQQTTDLAQLRGYEGAIAKLYFSGLGQMITNSGFSLVGRNRRPPKDPVNSLLSFGYTLLFNNVMSLILAEGLNPYLGNLHRSDRKEPHLAFDLMEEFRAPVVDSLAIALVNQKILRPTDFTFPNPEGGVYLESGARRVFLKQFEERISETFAHPTTDQQVSYRRAIQLQVQAYKKCLQSSEGYQPFIRSSK